MTDLTTNGLQIDLASTGARFSAVELKLPETLGKPEWAQLGIKLHRTEQVVQWWIGDWAAFGAPHPESPGWRKHGALLEFCKANEFDYGSISNKATISRSIHNSLRRERVPLSFFACLTRLKPREQKYWVERIEREKLTRGALRTAIRISEGEENALLSDGPRMEFGTQYFDDLKGWLLKRTPEFWTEDRKEIWEKRVMELAKIVSVCHAA